jgi:xanthine phosphoribosyltransferase
MQALVERIRREAVYRGDGFVDHQIDPQLTDAMGVEFTDKLRDLGIGSLDRLITAEVSGIPPAMATARELGVPLVCAR